MGRMRMLALLTAMWVACVASSSSFPRPFVVAHRGYSMKAPENTLPAFTLAAQSGADGIETDLQFTKDMQIVVLHDTTLDRTTNCTGYLSNYTYAELAVCDASYVEGFNFEQYRGTKIPLFSEVLALARNLSLFVVMDYKSNIPLGSALATIVPPTGMTARVYGSCWEPWQVRDIANNLPGAPLQNLTSGENYNTSDFWHSVVASGVNGFSIDFSNITQNFVIDAHKSLLSVAVWTVNDPQQMKTAIGYGVDAILTDNPPLLFSVVEDTKDTQDDRYIGVHKWVIVAVGVSVFAVTSMIAGVAIFLWRKSSKYERISRSSAY